MHSHMSPWEYTLGWTVIGTDLSPAHDICKVSRQPFPNIPRWRPHLLHTTMQELFTMEIAEAQRPCLLSALSAGGNLGECSHLPVAFFVLV